MAKKGNKIIIDTNLWISFLLSNQYSKIDALISEGTVKLLFSQELLDEFVEVSQQPKFKKYFAISDLENILLKIHDYAAFVNVTSVVNKCADPKDNFLLSLAKDGKATHLITGDKELLNIKSFGKTKILSITEYLSEK